MTKPNTKPLQQWTHQLGYLSQLMASGTASAAEADRFYELVNRVCELPPEQETRLFGEVLGTLAQIGDAEGARWLAEELDIEAQLQYLPNATGRERACLLFALPVVLPSGASLQQHASDSELFSQLHDILQEADVVNSAADLGLVPRVFSYLELFSKSYGELSRLTRHLGQQVLSGQTELVLPEWFEGEPSPQGACVSPYVDLYFLVGLVSCSDAELDEVFPALATDGEDRGEMAFTDEGGAQPIQSDDPGHVETGEPWEGPFCQAFEDAFGVIQGALTVLPPDGLPEDLRRGLELSREIGLLQMMECHVPPEAAAVVRLGPLHEQDGEWLVQVDCLVDGHIAETLNWKVLNHEAESDAVDKLVECLGDAGIATETPLTDFHNPAANLTLH